MSNNPNACDGNDNDRSNDESLVKITNPNVQVTLPVLKYGYRTTKATWEELVQILQVEKNIFKISRSKAQQHEYEVFRYHVKQQYASILDYILVSIFAFEAVPCETSSPKRRAHPRLQDVTTPTILLVENDYPYYLADNVVHFVLWKLKEPLLPQEIRKAREELLSGAKTKRKTLDLLQWVNPPNLKSIPEIDHVHFLCKLE